MGYETAKLEIEGKSEPLPVQFNPAEYNLSKGVSYTDKKVLGMDNPFTQFISGEAETLKMTLMFDTYLPPSDTREQEGGSDVRKKTDKIIELMDLDPTMHRPPIVTFCYGSLQFRGVITEANQSFTMFLGNGMPVRAKLDLTFRAVEKPKTVPLESPDRTKRRTIHESQSLWMLAWEEYGDPQMWKVIAKENHIKNPLDLKPGQVLKLPAI